MLKTLPDAVRAAAMDIRSNEQATHNPRLHLLNAANAFESRGNSAAYQAALAYPPVLRVNGREGSWQLKLTPADEGMHHIEIVLRPGTNAPTAADKAPAWMNDKLDALDYTECNPSLPARFTAPTTPAVVQTATTTTTAALAPHASSTTNNRAQSLARTLERTTDANSVPRNISLADLQSAVSTLRAGAVDVAARAQGTRGNSVGFGGETVSAATLTALADRLELLATRMGGAPTSGTKIAADKAVAISATVAGATTANQVPRNVSRADLENAAFTLRAGALDVQAAVAGTRGNQTTWGGQLTSASMLLGKADHCTELALLMKQAGY
jgi:hypothetical protein